MIILMNQWDTVMKLHFFMYMSYSRPFWRLSQCKYLHSTILFYSIGQILLPLIVYHAHVELFCVNVKSARFSLCRAASVLLPLIGAPYIGNSAYVHECFVSNLLRVACYMPDKRAQILQKILDHMLKLDVRVFTFDIFVLNSHTL